MMKGILIFTNQQVLLHKLKDGKKSEDEYCYWETNKMPTRFVETLNLEKSPRITYEENFRYRIIKPFPLYFAIKGQVKGYFMIEKIEQGEMKDYWLIFYSESWHPIKDGEILKPSQGWRYYEP